MSPRCPIFHASTFEVHGEPTLHPQPESYWGDVNPIDRRMHSNDGRVVTTPIMRALRDEPIAIRDADSQTHSFYYIGDMMDAFVALMAAPADFLGPASLGSSVQCTIRESAEKAVLMTGSKRKIEYQSLPSDDPQPRQPEIGLVRAKLGSEPRVVPRAGLRQTIDYLDRLLGGVRKASPFGSPY